MTTARHLIALLKSHIAGDEDRFLSTAMQVAAHEARQGHGKLALELRDLIDGAKAKGTALEKKAGPVPIVQPKGELANLLAAHYPDVRLADMVLPKSLIPAAERKFDRRHHDPVARCAVAPFPTARTPAFLRVRVHVGGPTRHAG